MTIKAMVSAVAIFALTSTPWATAVDKHPVWDGAVDVALQTLDLTDAEIAQVQDAVQSFRIDRKKSRAAQRSAAESMPPLDEVLAVRTYSETGLEAHLSHLLSEEQLATLMRAFEEQRDRQGRLHAQR